MNSPRASTVLDPFLGLGSSAIAAYECKVRSFVGFDLEQEFLRYAQARLDESARAPAPLDLHLGVDGAAAKSDDYTTTSRRTNRAEPLVKAG